MKLITEVIIISVIGAILYNAVKGIREEYSHLVSVSCGVCVLLILIPEIKVLILRLKSIFPVSAEAYESTVIFIKCLIISRVCEMTKSYCEDSKNSFLSSCVDLSEKAAVLITALPLIESVIKIIAKFIGE